MVALLLLPVEALLLMSAGPVQVVGPNAFRLPLADWLSNYMKLGQVASFQLAGVMFDIKKWLVYGCFGYQLRTTRLLLCDVYPSPHTASSRPSLALVRQVFRWGTPRDWIVGSLCTLLVVAVYWHNYWTASTTGHVWGPVGKGLLAAGWPYMNPVQRAFLVAYRAWYLTLLPLLFIITALTMPGYLRLVRASSVAERFDDQSSLAQTLAAIDVTLAVPLLGILGLALLSSWSRWLGAGGLAGVAGQSAGIAVGFLTLWLVMGLRRLVKVRLPSGGRIIARWEALVRLRRVIVSLGAMGLLGLWMGLWHLGGHSESNEGMPESLEAAVLARSGEYLAWDEGRAFRMRDQVRRDLKALLANLPSERRIVDALGASTQLQERTMVTTVLARSMLLDLYLSNRTLRESVARLQGRDPEPDQWALGISVQGALVALSPVVRGFRAVPIPRDFDADYLRASRPVSIYEMLMQFDRRREVLASLARGGEADNSDLPEPIRSRCREISERLRWEFGGVMPNDQRYPRRRGQTPVISRGGQR